MVSHSLKPTPFFVLTILSIFLYQQISASEVSEPAIKGNHKKSKTTEISEPLAIKSDRKEPEVLPVVHWALNGNFDDSMGHYLDIKAPKDIFSNDGINNSQAMSFDHTGLNAIVVSNLKTEPKADLFRYSYRERTISFWFKALKPEKPTKQAQCLFRTGGRRKSTAFYLLNDKLHVRIMNTFNLDVTIKKILKVDYKLDQWNHVAFRFNRGTFTLFFNGKNVGQDSFKNMSEFPPTGEGTVIGSSGSRNFFNASNMSKNSHAYSGLIDEIKLFDIALTNQNIKKLFQNQKLFQARPTKKYTPKYPKSVVPEANQERSDKAKDKNAHNQITIVEVHSNQPLPASAFQPDPDIPPQVSNEAEIQLPASAQKSADQTRFILGGILAVLVILGLGTIGFMVYRKDHEPTSKEDHPKLTT